MEMNNFEIVAIESSVVNATNQQLAELNELQLALAGGGMGTVVLG
jgi:hypothetical protein